jgi:excisionase family DNA binding protein
MDYVTVERAAALLLCSPDTIRQMIAEGRFEGVVRVRKRGRLLIPKQSLASALVPVHAARQPAAITS